MKLSQASQAIIAESIKTALYSFQQAEENVVTDIYLQPCQSNNKLVIYDDEDNTISSAIVNEFETIEEDDFYAVMSKNLTAILNQLNEEQALDTKILKPFNFVLVDANKESISDLFIVDDDTIIIDNELLKGLDEELDEFITKLLEE